VRASPKKWTFNNHIAANLLDEMSQLYAFLP